MNNYTNTDEKVSKFVDSLNFKEFDPHEQLEPVKNFFGIILAPRRSGKSVLMKDMLSKIYKWYDEAYLFSETLDGQPELYDYVPKDNCFDGFDTEKIDEVWKKQKEKILEAVESEVDKSKCPYVLLIFDDVIADKKVRNSGVLDKLSVEGRHFNIAVIILSQEVGGKYGINKVCRGNSDLIIAFYLNSHKDRELITDQFLSMNSKKEADPIFKKVTTKKYQAIIICNFINSRNYEDKVFTYNAKLKVPKFTIGKNKKAQKNSYLIVKNKNKKNVIYY